MEFSVAETVPLWRTLREQGVTALVTPALDYVGALELSPGDPRFQSDDTVAAVGEGLRALVASLEDGASLLLLYRVTHDAEEIIREYESITGGAQVGALRAYVAARASWLRAQPLRRVRVFAFFSLRGKSLSGLARGQLGARLVFGREDRVTAEAHLSRLKDLGQLRNRIQGRLSQLGLPACELSPDDVWRLHYQLLNPTGARARRGPPRIAVRDALWNEATLRQVGEHAREYSESEQLCHETIEDARGHFRHGEILRRVLTLKVLPERATDYFAAEPFLSLAARVDGAERPVPFTLAVAVNVAHQSTARWVLNARHRLVDALRRSLPFGAPQGIDSAAGDEAHKESIQELFQELHEMYSKIVSVSASLLLEAQTLELLDAYTEAARAAFNRAGNSELEVEDYSQLPAFLSMLPGAGRYQLRKKGCTSRNAGDLLPVFAPWRGCSRAASVLLTPTGDAFKFDLFDPQLGNAFHGLVAADTGSGKSVSLGFLTLDALASGVHGILVDNGESWKAMTELMGGIYIPLNSRTSISPFPALDGVLGDAGAFESEEIKLIVDFLDLCVRDPGAPGFDVVTTDVVARAVQIVYERLRQEPGRRPLIADFRDALSSYGPTQQDQQIAQGVARRLAIYCDGLYAEFLNRESKLRFDHHLLTFDMAGVSQDPLAKKLAMATIMQAIGNRARTRRQRTLVEVDEGHEYLGTDAVAEKFLAGCYRKMRKFDVAMWMVSQNLSDFIESPVGGAILQNSVLKIFLQHGAGKARDRVVEYFKLPPRAAAAFGALDRRAGHYSDLFLMYGKVSTTARLALHPLAYWILTTDPVDKELIGRAAEKNRSCRGSSCSRSLPGDIPTARSASTIPPTKEPTHAKLAPEGRRRDRRLSHLPRLRGLGEHVVHARRRHRGPCGHSPQRHRDDQRPQLAARRDEKAVHRHQKARELRRRLPPGFRLARAARLRQA